MSHLTQSGMPKGRPFPENELVWLTCDVDGCEYHVRVHQSTQEANMRQHKEKGCPLVTTGDETPEVKDRSPLELQAPLCPEPCSDCSCLECHDLPDNWNDRVPLAPATTYCDRKLHAMCGYGCTCVSTSEPLSRDPSLPVESTPSHSWGPLSKALSDEKYCNNGCTHLAGEEHNWKSKARTFDTGASRDTDDGKYDYEGFISPLVLQRFAAYMHEHRYQSDGTLRDSDNWQRGIPLDEYMKSGFRHFMEWWLIHRDHEDPDNLQDVLCAVLFNVQGYLHELLRTRDSKADEGQYR